MELFICIGNLGADAEFKSENGNEYVKFNVAETRRWKDQQGNNREETVWNSCIMHGRNENLLPFLTKGTKVLVVGRGSVRVYSSPKLRQMVAGININVDRLELIAVNREVVDRQVVSPDGNVLNVQKLYYIDYRIARQWAAEASQAIFYNRKGEAAYYVDYNGFVTPIKNEDTPDGNMQEDAPLDVTDENMQENAPDDSKNAPDDSKQRERAKGSAKGRNQR